MFCGFFSCSCCSVSRAACCRISGRCLCVHERLCASNRWPFAPSPLEESLLLLRLLSHSTSAALIPAKRNSTTLSPPRPAEPRQLSRSGAFSRTDCFWIRRRRHTSQDRFPVTCGGLTLCILSVRPLMTKSSLFCPPTTVSNNQPLHHNTITHPLLRQPAIKAQHFPLQAALFGSSFTSERR